MAKDSLETSHQTPFEQDREGLAHMPVLRVRAKHEIDACTFDDELL